MARTLKDSRQDQIEKLEIGDSVAVCRRLPLDFGVPKDAIETHTRMLRNVLDRQASRARKHHPFRRYTVENASGITLQGALIITVCCTRTD